MMKKSNILFYDIETSPNMTLSWGIGGKIYLSPENLVEERKIICISYKWADEKKVHNLNWGTKQDDKRVVQEFSKVLQDADCVVYHNGDRYDKRFIAGRVIYHDLAPIKHVTSVDTYKLAKKYLNINSHRLDYLGKYLKVGKKLDHEGYSLWKKTVLQNDAAALKKMVSYCNQDVLLLEQVFEKLKPLIRSKPQLRALSGDSYVGCIDCNGPVHHHGTYVNKWGRVQRYRCVDCGRVFSGTKLTKG